MNKKLMTGLGLTLATILLAGAAFADTYTGNDTTGSWANDPDGGKTEMTLTVPAAYTVVIPATIDLGNTGVYTADTYVGADNNVYIAASSKIAAGDKITVTLPTGQDFTARQGSSAIPLTVGITPSLTTGTTEALIEGKTTAKEETILTRTGAEIGAATNNTNLAATLKAKASSTDINAATLSGEHKGYVTFAVSKTTPTP